MFADRGAKYLSFTEGVLAVGTLDDIGFICNGLDHEERHFVSQRTRHALRHKKAKRAFRIVVQSRAEGD